MGSWAKASCCNVEVVKGGLDSVFLIFLLTSLTLKVAGSFESISSASCSFFMTSCSSFASILLSNKPWIVQYSLEIKVEISFSLSVINFNTTDWTLPADKEPIFILSYFLIFVKLLF